MRTRCSLLLSFAMALVLYGCGSGSGGGGGSASVIVSISPQETSLYPGQVKAFAATVNNSTNSSVSWSVQEGVAGGTLSNDGTYTAPAITGDYHIIATSQADSTKTAIATVHVANTLEISPSVVPLTFGQTQQFKAKFNGNDTTSIVWRVQPNGAQGTITAGGLYTAPRFYPTSTGPHLDIITATSTQDTTVTSTAVVNVNAGNGNILIQ